MTALNFPSNPVLDQVYTAGGKAWKFNGVSWTSVSLADPVSSFNTRTGDVTLESGDVTGALGFTPYNSTNPNGYTTNTGDVVGPVSSTDNSLVRFDTTTGKLVQNSTVTLDDTGSLAGILSEQFDTTTTPPTVVEGTLAWDSGNGTLESGLKGGTVTYKLGQQEFARVYNGSGSAMTKGQVVYITGAQGNRVDVRLAIANAESTSAGTIGFVAEAIANGSEGFVQVSGTLPKLDTSALTAGAALYLSAATAGAYTTTRPAAPNHTVILGWVERVHANAGSIYVKVDNGYELDELHNVLISSAANSQVLQYDSAAGVWRNHTLVAADIPSLDAGKITSGIIDAARLPSYVDDVLEAANLAAFPSTGETGKIYVALDTNKTYRWSGSAYVYITSGAVDSVAGKTGVVTLASSDVGLGNVENKSSATIRGELTSGNVTGALGFTPYNSTNPSSYITSSALTNYLPLSGGTLSGNLSLNSGLVINLGGQSDTVGYNATAGLGTYIKGTSNTYVYGGGSFYDGTTHRTLLHAGNYGSYALPLSGGTLTGAIGFAGNVYNTVAGSRFFGFSGSTNYLYTATTGGMTWRNQADTSSIASLSDTGAFNAIGAITQGGNQVLHAGNYSSYAQNRIVDSGGSGSYVQLSSSNELEYYNSSGVLQPLYLQYSGAADSLRGPGGNVILHAGNYTSYNGHIRALGAASTSIDWNDLGNSYQNSLIQVTPTNFTSTTNGPTAASYQYGTLLNLSTGSSSSRSQVYISHNGNDLIFRGGWDGASWQTWNKVLTNQNYTSYSPSLTGTGASGTWGISITGNAASISNFATTTTTTVGTDNAASGIGYISAISLFGQTDGALYSHVYSTSWKHNIFGDYRTGQLAVRGKNSGTWQAWRTVLDSGNYSSYSPSLTGTGASGTWNIAITGNAVSATALQTARTINGVSFNGTANITVYDATKLNLDGGTLLGNLRVQSGGLAVGISSMPNMVSVGEAINVGAAALVSTSSNSMAIWSNGYLDGTSGLIRSKTFGKVSWLDIASGAFNFYASTVDVNGSQYSTAVTSGRRYTVSTVGNTTLAQWQALFSGLSAVPTLNQQITATATGTLAGTGSVWQFVHSSEYAQRLAISASTGVLNAISGLLQNGYQVVHAGNVGSYALPLSGGTITTSGSSTSLVITDTGINGANIKLIGNGATTPNKHIRSYNGNFEIINSAYSGTCLVLTDAGNLTATGNVTAYSDERLKRDWAPMPADFVERLASVKSGTYTRIDSGERQAGSSAQDWQLLLPEVVSQGGGEAKTLALAYGNAALVSAVELAKDNVELRARVERLESLIEQLLNKE